MLTIRKAKPEDCDTVFKWRNHPKVRRYFFNPRELKYSEHKKWFFESLNKEDRILLIALERRTPVGVIRFDLKSPEDQTAEVDIYVDPEKTGQGLGKIMLWQAEEWLRQNTDTHVLIAKVKEKNLSSIRMFKSCKFYTDYIQFRKEL